MIFSIDTTNKTITLSQSIDLQEFIGLVPKIFTKDSVFGDMTGYTLKVSAVTYTPFTGYEPTTTTYPSYTTSTGTNWIGSGLTIIDPRHSVTTQII